jgi:hypothetical protein
MTNLYPHELQFGDVYVTPVLVVLSLAFVASLIMAFVLNKTKLAKWFVLPQYVFLAIMVLYVVLIDKYFIRF